MHSFGTLGRTADSANSRTDRPQVWAFVLGTGKGAESSHENLHSKCHGRALRTRTNMKISCVYKERFGWPVLIPFGPSVKLTHAGILSESTVEFQTDLLIS